MWVQVEPKFFFLPYSMLGINQELNVQFYSKYYSRNIKNIIQNINCMKTNAVIVQV